MATILGMNAYHGDASACLVIDGKLVAAVEEERFRRIKHWAGFPYEAIRYCLKAGGISLNKLDHIAVNSDPKANLLKKIKFALTKRPDLGLVLNRIKNAKKRSSVEEELKQAFPEHNFQGKVHHIEHHLAHLASCFFVSPFQEAVTVSVDGFGDFSSAAWGVGKDSSISINNRVYFPHSLGIFYQALTQYLGFPHYGDEYKVMGLAPYGKPSFMDEMQQIVLLQKDGSFRLKLDFFRHHKEKIDYEWAGGTPVVGNLFSKDLIKLLGPARKQDEPLGERHWDIAHSIQQMYEKAFFHLLNTLHQRYKLDELTLAGGCAMNSVANGKIYRNTPFKKVYIQSAAGDAGGAIGAAFVVSEQVDEKSRDFVMDHAYWGTVFSDEEIGKILDSNSDELKAEACQVEYIEDEAVLCQRTAEAIADAKVVGWFQGRMEWGPRALGNRSIVCDPRRADMKDILNLKIKRRESFRPFAPSILREAVGEWFEEDDSVPFMMKVFQIKAENRSNIPAVTHADGSGRLQTVFKDTNPKYYHLIEAFREISGVPIVLNTSFNENEPVVCKPEEALACFLRTKMDVLVMGNYFIWRSL
jgi:carbamoyltransferase